MAELRTARLVLRDWRDADRPRFAELNADAEVMRWLASALTRQQSDDLASRLAADLEREGWGLWALEERATRRFVGFTGLARPGFDAPFVPAVEIGWRLARDAWGQGFATESARAAAAHGFGELALDEIVSFTAAGNARSRAVMARLGMRHDRAGGFDHPLVRDERLRRHVLYRLTADEWRMRAAR